MTLARPLDPRAVLVMVEPGIPGADPAPIVVEPSAEAGVAAVVDGASVVGRLSRHGPARATLMTETDGTGSSVARIVVLRLPAQSGDAASRATRREVVVDGWRFELSVESARHATLRRRAERGRDAVRGGGPHEVRAIIPGQVASVAVVPGQAVEAGTVLLVLEAMKMQNELRAPRAGTVARVAVVAGQTVEVGDLLVVVG